MPKKTGRKDEKQERKEEKSSDASIGSPMIQEKLSSSAAVRPNTILIPAPFIFI